MGLPPSSQPRGLSTDWGRGVRNLELALGKGQWGLEPGIRLKVWALGMVRPLGHPRDMLDTHPPPQPEVVGHAGGGVSWSVLPLVHRPA